MKQKIMMAKLFAFLIIAAGANMIAEGTEWKTAILDDGKITVKYNISEYADENGDTKILIQDNTTMTDRLDYEKCISMMKDVSQHAKFMGDFSSEVIKRISDNEWLVYYYTKNPWPIADSDCVATMILSEDPSMKTAVFTFTAAPELMDTKNRVSRMNYYNITYTFKDTGNGNVEIIETGKTNPPMKVPLWLVRSAFPETPVSMIRKFALLVRGK